MDGDEGLLCDSTFEFGEAVLTATVSEFEQATGDRQEELLEFGHQLLLYILLIESMTPLAIPLVTPLKQLLQGNDLSVGKEDVCQKMPRTPTSADRRRATNISY